MEGLSVEVVAIGGNYQIFPLKCYSLFILIFCAILTHKMKAASDLFLRIEVTVLMFYAVISRHKCFEPSLIAYSSQVTKDIGARALLSTKASGEINLTTAVPPPAPPPRSHILRL